MQQQMERNVNIYANLIKDILLNKPEKALVIYGAGHIYALRSMLAAHPAIELVDFDAVF